MTDIKRTHWHLDCHPMNVGLVGVGPMGLGVGRSLLRCLLPQGHRLVVYNRTPERTAPLIDAGARRVETPALAADADVVFSIVADDSAVTEVTMGEAGIIAGLKPESVHVGLSTVSIDLADRLVAAHRSAERRYVSAPVVGRPQVAAQGELVLLAGGNDGDIARIRPILDAIAKRIFIVGEWPAQANLMKLAINHLVHNVVESLAEFFALTEKGGVPRQTARDTLTATSFDAPIYDRFAALILDGSFGSGVAGARLALKDNRAILSAAEKYGVPLPFASIVHDRLIALIARNGPEIDYAAISELARRDAGLL